MPRKCVFGRKDSNEKSNTLFSKDMVQFRKLIKESILLISAFKSNLLVQMIKLFSYLGAKACSKFQSLHAVSYSTFRNRFWTNLNRQVQGVNLLIFFNDWLVYDLHSSKGFLFNRFTESVSSHLFEFLNKNPQWMSSIIISFAKWFPVFVHFR